MQNPAFRQFEHQFWNKTSTPYDSGLGAVTAQTVKHILKTLSLKPGQTLLDIACGPGYVTRMAQGQGTKVTGVDFSAAMVELARQVFPQSDFQIGDAESLDFADEAFDAVSCNFGMMHFANPEQAMKEAFRVLRPGGTYVFTVWNPPELSPAMNLIFEAIKTHAQNAPQAPEGPPFFFYANRHNAESALKSAGFKTIERQILTLDWPIESAETYIRHFYDGGARIGGTLRAQTPETLNKIAAHISNKLLAPSGESLYALPVSVVMYSAGK